MEIDHLGLEDADEPPEADCLKGAENRATQEQVDSTANDFAEARREKK
jgi:hypothetical protein